MCMINHTFGVVFVHVPKNAGTAISHFLSPLTTYRDQEIGGTALGHAASSYYMNRFGLAKHSTALRIREAMGFDTFQAYSSFAVVRDPVDRVHSIYRFLQRWLRWRELPAYTGHAPVFDAYGDVNDFVRSEMFQTDGPGLIFRPQSTWVCDESKEIMVDRLIRFEKLQQGIEELVEELDLPADRLESRLTVRNESRSGPSDALLDARSIAIVHERYASDYGIFGY